MVSSGVRVAIGHSYTKGRNALSVDKGIGQNMVEEKKHIQNLTQEHVGKEITCFINKRRVRAGKIQYSHGLFYICQDVISGSPCADTFEFKYSWCVDDGTSSMLISNAVSKLMLLSDVLWDEGENL